MTSPNLSKTDLHDGVRTPTNNCASTANHWDCNNAEQELSIERTKLAREIRKTRRLELQIAEYRTELSRSVQSYNQAIGQAEYLKITNLGLCQELHRSRSLLQTLETVIKMLSTTSPERHNETAGGQEEADGRRE